MSTHGPLFGTQFPLSALTLVSGSDSNTTRSHDFPCFLTSPVCGSGDKSVTGGSATTKVFYLGAQVYTSTDDICKLETCPTQKGDTCGSKVIAMPKFSPPVTQMSNALTTQGKYVAQSSAIDQDGNMLYCIKVEFSL